MYHDPNLRQSFEILRIDKDAALHYIGEIKKNKKEKCFLRLYETMLIIFLGLALSLILTYTKTKTKNVCLFKKSYTNIFLVFCHNIALKT